MNDVQAKRILDSMISFIKQHGEEEVSAINTSADNEFIVQKNNFVSEEKVKITENFKNELENQEVRLKIEKSKQQNTARIEKMKRVNEIVETLRTDLKSKVRQEMMKDKNQYKQLMRDLLIQVS